MPHLAETMAFFKADDGTDSSEATPHRSSNPAAKICVIFSTNDGLFLETLK